MGFVRFAMVRSVVLALLFVSSAVVLGISSFQTSVFLHNKYDRPWVIFALVLSALTILICFALAMQYNFRTHIGAIAFLAITWLALASYTTDRIGYVQCESLDNTRRPKSGDGTYDNVAWCREVKAVMGFSWFNFGLMMIAIVSWIRLQEYEEHEGLGHESESEREPYRAAEAGNYINRRAASAAYTNGYVNGGVVTGAGYPATTGGGQTVVYQQPGHNIVLQGGQIRQVPVGAPLY